MKASRNVVVSQQEFDNDIEECLLAVGRQDPNAREVKHRLATPKPVTPRDEVVAHPFHADVVPIEQIRECNQGREGPR
ncbi:hypothetical protein D3C85_1599430 [compost metagenome]